MIPDEIIESVWLGVKVYMAFLHSLPVLINIVKNKWFQAEVRELL